MIFYCLSKEFGWTTEQILDLPVNALNGYLLVMNEERRYVKPAEFSLEEIKAAVFGYLGVKTGAREVDKKTAGLPKVAMSKDEIAAWSKAGYPDLSRWLLKRRSK